MILFFLCSSLLSAKSFPMQKALQAGGKWLSQVQGIHFKNLLPLAKNNGKGQKTFLKLGIDTKLLESISYEYRGKQNIWIWSKIVSVEK